MSEETNREYFENTPNTQNAEETSSASADTEQTHTENPSVNQTANTAYGSAQANYGYPYSNPYQQQQAQPPYGNGYAPNGAPNYAYYGTPQSPQKKQVNQNGSKHKNKGLKIFFAAVAGCLVLAIIAVVIGVTSKNSVSKKPSADELPTASIQETPTAALTDAGGELTAKGVYEKVKETSVGILVYANSGFNNQALAGEGTGVIVGEDATGTYTYIVTCAHVIEGGKTVKVQLHDETQYDAAVVGLDSRTDIGVLRIRATGLKAAELGNSDTLSVGETVYAIGNPGGVAFAGSFTNGMVSAISRPIDSQIGYEMLCIQHTAAINPGNSGGALVNAYGQVIGINSSKIANEEYEGMGFAVPSVTVKEVFDEIVKNGYVTNRAKLGINYFSASSNQMYSMIVGANQLPAGTIVIQSVTTDSPLMGTEVQQGDMVMKVNGKPLDSADTLPDLIEDSKVGDELTLTICRVDTKNNYSISEFEVTVKLVEDKGNAAVTESTTQSSYYNPFGAYGYGN